MPTYIKLKYVLLKKMESWLLTLELRYNAHVQDSLNSLVASKQNCQNKIIFTLQKVFNKAANSGFYSLVTVITIVRVCLQLLLTKYI